jgi:hypothetical protein
MAEEVIGVKKNSIKTKKNNDVILMTSAFRFPHTAKR